MLRPTSYLTKRYDDPKGHTLAVYEADGGYEQARCALGMTREAVVDQMNLALFLAAGCRQINVLFLFWLPSTLSILVLVQRLGWCSSSRSTKRFKIIGLAVLVGVLAAGANIWIARTMIAAVDDEYRMTLGRTLSDRIDHFLARLTEQDRLRLAKAIASMTEDPEVQAAIMSQATIGSYYNGTNRQIAQELIRAGVPRAKIGFESDRVILAATTSYLASLHPVLLRAILQDFIAGFASASNERIAYAAFDANKSAAQGKVERPHVWKAIVNWPALELPYATYLADHARLDPYISLQGSITLGFLAVLTIGICMYASFRSRRLTETATMQSLLANLTAANQGAQVRNAALGLSPGTAGIISSADQPFLADLLNSVLQQTQQTSAVGTGGSTGLIQGLLSGPLASAGGITGGLALANALNLLPAAAAV